MKSLLLENSISPTLTRLPSIDLIEILSKSDSLGGILKAASQTGFIQYFVTLIGLKAKDLTSWFFSQLGFKFGLGAS